MKTMIRSFGLRGLLLGMLLVPAVAQEDDKEFGWEPKRIGEMEYVPMEKVAAFYGFKPLERKGADLLLQTDTMKMSLTLGSPDFQINGMNLILGGGVVEEAGGTFLSRADLGGFIDPILRPNQIKGAGQFNTVILDPAFGGTDQGMVTPLGSAAQHTLEIAKLSRGRLEKQGFKVVMTREEDRDLSSAERVALANAVRESAVFISITFRGEPGKKGFGTSALLVPSETVEEQSAPRASVALGVAVHGAVIRYLNTNTVDLGLRGDSSTALSGVHHPSITLSVANLADDSEVDLAANEKFQDVVSRGVLQGVQRYRSAVTRRKNE